MSIAKAYHGGVIARFVVLFVLCGHAVAAQAPLAPAVSIAQGFRAYERDHYDQAAVAFERGLQQARSTQDEAAEAEALRGVGLVRYRRSRLVEAREALEQSLAICTRLEDERGAARTRSALAIVVFAAGDATLARGLYEQALHSFERLGDDREIAEALYGLARVSSTFDARTPELLSRALELARRVGDSRVEGAVLHLQGDGRFLAGDYTEALQLLNAAASRLERAGAKSNLARVFVSIGRLYRAHGRPSNALPFYERALAIQEAIGDRMMASQTHNAMAVAYAAMGRTPEAVGQYRQAIVIAHQIGAWMFEVQFRSNLANSYNARKQFQRAAALLEAVADRTPNSYMTSMVNSQLSEAYLGLRRYRQALDAVDKALGAGAIEASHRPSVLFNRAKAHAALGREDAALGREDEALAASADAMAAIERLRDRLIPSDFLKQGFGELNQDLFSFTVARFHKAGRSRDALEMGERARARAFLDLLATRETRSVKANDDARAPASGADGLAVPSSGLATPASVDDLAAIARRLGSVIVSYWVTTETTLVWVVDRDGHVETAAVAVPAARLAALISQTSVETGPASNTAVNMSRGESLIAAGRRPTEALRALHELLIRPVARFLPRERGSLLTIVPHGALFRLSFAALLDERDRYLIERYRLHYVPSGGSLLYLQRRPERDRTSATYLLVADPREAPAVNGTALPPLPGARREVAAIARTLPAGTATMMIGAGATEARVRPLLSGHAVVHLAAHGVLHDDRPLDSFIALGRRGRSGADDGRLTTADIYGLSLDADLVVLSACRSARGAVTGDGVLGMTRAFMYAGTPSIVASLWDLPDQSGAELMPAFYKSWRAGHDKSGALRDAQLRLIARLRAGRVSALGQGPGRALPEHPLLWAGFVLLGEP